MADDEATRDDSAVSDAASIAVEDTRRLVERGEITTLIVNNLDEADLTAIAWSGSSLHIKSVSEQLQRPASAVEYLCVRAPTVEPIAKAGIDYEDHIGSGTVWQVAVHPELQGLGLGSYLIGFAEDRIRGRGLASARIGVDDGNDEALRLYVRLGYTPCGRSSSSWPALDDNGQEYEHHASGTDLEKAL